MSKHYFICDKWALNALIHIKDAKLRQRIDRHSGC